MNRYCFLEDHMKTLPVDRGCILCKTTGGGKSFGEYRAVEWKDTEEIVSLLEEFYPEQDIFALRFTELRDMVIALPGFNDDNECNEGILEAIQMGWVAEREEK